MVDIDPTLGSEFLLSVSVQQTGLSADPGFSNQEIIMTCKHLNQNI